MRLFAKTAFCTALAAFSLAALEKEVVDQILVSARTIERDAATVGAAVKTKKFDGDHVKSKVEAMAADVARLQEVVSQFDAANPTLADRDRAQWDLLKQKVQLLEIFHSQKQELVAADPARHRAMIRAHANGVAMRARRIQETANKLQRGPA